MSHTLMPYEYVIVLDNPRSKMQVLSWCRENIGEWDQEWRCYTHWAGPYPARIVFGFATTQDLLAFTMAWGS
jgi:hypothetical protein